jgi:ribonuclease BN (tRNA processing enzyme)
MTKSSFATTSTNISVSDAKLTILGCMAGAPIGDSPASGYLLEVGEEKILIDCGPGVVAALAQLDLAHHLTAVLISHRHADHCADLIALAYARLFPKVFEPLPLFGPADLQQTLEGLNTLFAIPSLPSLQQPLTSALPFTSLAPNAKHDVAGLELHTHLMQHPVETFAYQFPELGFVYTADGCLTDGLVAFTKGCRTLLAEATYLKDTLADVAAHGHMTSLEAASLAKRSGTKQLILTHFVTPSQSAKSLTEARECFEVVDVASPMKSFLLE